MGYEPYEVIVAGELKPLIPGYLENRRRDLAALEAAFGRSDLDQVSRLAHRLKEIGGAYGFRRITELGVEMEEAALRGEAKAVEARIFLYRDYLARLQVTFA